MSSPMVAGAEVARLKWVVRQHLGIWLRAPLWRSLEHVRPIDVHIILLDAVRRRLEVAGLRPDIGAAMRCDPGFNAREERVHLGLLAVALTALEHYYQAIGAKSDGQRMRDMRWPVDELLREYEREVERRRDNAHADMWMGAFASHPWPGAVGKALGRWASPS